MAFSDTLASHMSRESRKYRDKYDLIRTLVKDRIQGNDIAEIDSMPEFYLMGLPEATIVTIISIYVSLKTQDIADLEIFMVIEKHRSEVGSGVLPDPLNIMTYIMYRISIEHGHVAFFSPTFIQHAITEAYNYFCPGKSESPILANKKNKWWLSVLSCLIGILFAAPLAYVILGKTGGFIFFAVIIIVCGLLMRR